MNLTPEQQTRIVELLRGKLGPGTSGFTFLVDLLFSKDLAAQLAQILDEAKLELDTKQQALGDVRKAEDDQIAADTVLLDDLKKALGDSAVALSAEASVVESNPTKGEN